MAPGPHHVQVQPPAPLDTGAHRSAARPSPRHLHTASYGLHHTPEEVDGLPSPFSFKETLFKGRF